MIPHELPPFARVVPGQQPRGDVCPVHTPIRGAACLRHPDIGLRHKGPTQTASRHFPADVLDHLLGRAIGARGFLSHLHSYVVTMRQKPSVPQDP